MPHQDCWEMNRGSDTEPGEDEWFGAGPGTHGPLDSVPESLIALGLGAGGCVGTGVCERSSMIGARES